MPYSTEFINDLERTMTRARLSRYLAASKGDLELALELYEKNVLLSENLFGFLHGLEVTIRNSLHTELSADLGVQDWFHDGLPLPWPRPAPSHLTFTRAMQDMIANARGKAGSNATVGKLIAELPFGFWTLLVGNRFDELWRRSLYKAFPHARVRRQIIHWRLDGVRFLRNRIAHHEPVISSNRVVYTGFSGQPSISLPAMLECVSWVSPATADWLRTSTRYEAARALLEATATRGIHL